MGAACIFIAFLILLASRQSASMREDQDLDVISIDAQTAQGSPDFKVDLNANTMVDTIIQRFRRSPWFKAMVTPAYFVENELNLNNYIVLKNVRIRGLGQHLQRMGDATVKKEASATVLKVTLGPWRNLTLEADYASALGGQVGGSLSGSVHDLAVSFLTAVEGRNAQDFKVVLRDFDVVDHGPFQLNSLTGLWILSTPTRYILNLLLPALQARAVPLIEEKVKSITTMMLEDAQTLVLLRP